MAMMEPTVTAAIISGLVTLLVAAIAATGTFLGARATLRNTDQERISKLESRVDRLERNQGKLVAYAQELRDHIFRGAPPPPPPWPDLD